MKILIVEDDLQIAIYLADFLVKNGFEVLFERSIEKVLVNRLIKDIDLIILDLMLEGRSGDYLVRKIREEKENVPIIILSGLRNVDKKIALLNMGVDDYMTKPFDEKELLARIRALYRRYEEMRIREEKDFGEVVFSQNDRKLKRENKEIPLTSKEMLVLKILIANVGKTVGQEFLEKRIWNLHSNFHSNVVQATVCRLRKKIDDGFKHKLIKCIRGVGYKFELPES